MKEEWCVKNPCINQSQSQPVLVVTCHQYGICVVVPQASFHTKSSQWWNSEISVVFSGFQPVYNNNNIVYYTIKKVFRLLWQRHSVQKIIDCNFCFC